MDKTGSPLLFARFYQTQHFWAFSQNLRLLKKKNPLATQFRLKFNIIHSNYLVLLKRWKLEKIFFLSQPITCSTCSWFSVPRQPHKILLLPPVWNIVLRNSYTLYYIVYVFFRFLGVGLCEPQAWILWLLEFPLYKRNGCLLMFLLPSMHFMGVSIKSLLRR